MAIPEKYPSQLEALYDAGKPGEDGRYSDPIVRTRVIVPKREDVEELGRQIADVVPEDPIQHPPYYEAGPCEAHEARAWIHDRLAPYDPQLARTMYEVLKYCWRAGHKGDPAEDCRKARWYLGQL